MYKNFPKSRYATSIFTYERGSANTDLSIQLAHYYTLLMVQNNRTLVYAWPICWRFPAKIEAQLNFFLELTLSSGLPTTLTTRDRTRTAEGMATDQVFLKDGDVHVLQSSVISVTPFDSFTAAAKALFPRATEDQWIVVTAETIFHPQGGGQPSDVGEMRAIATGAKFTVLTSRVDGLIDGTILHLGTFEKPTATFTQGEQVTQAIDAEKRLLYSRWHTAGHTLDAAVRQVCLGKVAGLDKLKASHIPGSAACEYKGSIMGDMKASIQAQLDECLSKAAEVKIEFWTEEQVLRVSSEMLIQPDTIGVGADGKCRVVNIQGIDVCPCGGTHVTSLDACGKVVVTKISRNSGTSRVSYRVD